MLIVSTLVLVPDQPRAALGAELLVTGLLAWSILVAIHLKAVRTRVGPSRAALVARVVMAQVAVLPFLAAAVSLLLEAGGGLYWLVPGVVLCLVVAVLNVGAAHRDRSVRGDRSA